MTDIKSEIKSNNKLNITQRFTTSWFVSPTIEMWLDEKNHHFEVGRESVKVNKRNTSLSKEDQPLLDELKQFANKCVMKYFHKGQEKIEWQWINYNKDGKYLEAIIEKQSKVNPQYSLVWDWEKFDEKTPNVKHMFSINDTKFGWRVNSNNPDN